MSVVTKISGWIKTDGYERDYNNKIMKELSYDDNFIKMFCTAKETGTKNPDYINFGASINYCVFEEWLKKFEDFIKKLKAFNAIVFVDSESGGDKVFVIGYELDRASNGRFIKDTINLGDPIQYCINDEEDEFIFPLLFRILKKLDYHE